MSPLPLARSKNENEIKFDTSALLMAKATANRGLSAEYLLRMIESKVNATKDPKKYQSMLDNVRDYAVERKRQDSRDSAMTLQSEAEVRSPFQVLQQNTAKDAVATLGKLTQSDTPVKMGYGINDESQVKRFYTQEDKRLSAEAAKAADEILNAFLSEHNMITRDGVIYDYDPEKNDVATNDQGVPVRANREEIVKVISNPPTSPDHDPEFKNFDKYVAEISQDKIEIETKEYAYPVQKPAVEVKPPEVKMPAAAAKAPERAEPAPPERAEPAPEAKTPEAAEVEAEPTAPGSSGTV